MLLFLLLFLLHYLPEKNRVDSGSAKAHPQKIWVCTRITFEGRIRGCGFYRMGIFLKKNIFFNELEINFTVEKQSLKQFPGPGSRAVLV